MKRYFHKFINTRKSPRAPIDFDVCYYVNGEKRKSKATQLSKGGIFINTKKPSPVGTRIELSFILPGVDEYILVDGEVKWNNTKNGNRLPGMGIQFLNLDRFEKVAIGNYIEDKKEVFSQIQYLLSFKVPPIEWVQNLIKRTDLPKNLRDFDIKKLNSLRNKVNSLVKRFS